MQSPERPRFQKYWEDWNLFRDRLQFSFVFVLLQVHSSDHFWPQVDREFLFPQLGLRTRRKSCRHFLRLTACVQLQLSSCRLFLATYPRHLGQSLQTHYPTQRLLHLAEGFLAA